MPGKEADGPQILVVEDDKPIRELVEWSLREEGYRTDSARDGSEGLYKLTLHPADLIVVDYRLPFVSGAQFVRAVRGENHPSKTAKILMMTALEIAHVKRTDPFLRNRVDDFLQKPFDIDELLTAVDRLTRRSLATFTDKS